MKILDFVNIEMIFICVTFLLLKLKYLKNNRHVIILLLCLEMFIILNLLVIIYLVNLNLININFILIFFIIIVREACTGIRILVFLARNYGEELKKNF